LKNFPRVIPRTSVKRGRGRRWGGKKGRKRREGEGKKLREGNYGREGRE
jgi:hypothetical protein